VVTFTSFSVSIKDVLQQVKLFKYFIAQNSAEFSYFQSFDNLKDNHQQLHGKNSQYYRILIVNCANYF